MYDLGIAYAKGEKGLTKDAAQAFKWYKRGAIAGHTRCMSNLAAY